MTTFILCFITNVDSLGIDDDPGYVFIISTLKCSLLRRERHPLVVLYVVVNVYESCNVTHGRQIIVHNFLSRVIF